MTAKEQLLDFVQNLTTEDLKKILANLDQLKQIAAADPDEKTRATAAKLAAALTT